MKTVANTSNFDTLSLDEEGKKRSWEQIHSMWINPEIERRRKLGQLPDDFRMLRCLIKLPNDREPIVQFNEECQFEAIAKIPPLEKDANVGDPLFLHQVERIENVFPPQVDGKRVAFFFMWWTGSTWKIVFDASPNITDVPNEPGDDWAIGKFIAESIQAIIVEKTIIISDSNQNELRKIGLWAAPALIPYPLSAILTALQEDKAEKARKLLIDYCSPAKITSLVAEWRSVLEFSNRSELTEQALRAHCDNHYISAVHTLLPQVEGIISDWIQPHVKDIANVPFRQDSKTKKFRDIISTGLPSTYAYNRILTSAIEFILEGPITSSFEKWFDTLDTSFANRHVVGHGRYEPNYFTEENSIKLFLMLDTIFHLILGFRAQPKTSE